MKESRLESTFVFSLSFDDEPSKSSRLFYSCRKFLDDSESLDNILGAKVSSRYDFKRIIDDVEKGSLKGIFRKLL